MTLLELSEHHGCGDEKCYPLPGGICPAPLDPATPYGRTIEKVFRGKTYRHLCYEILFNTDAEKFHFRTSYFVGLDWVDINQEIAIYVTPKLNTDGKEIDYIKMVLEALQEPENLQHLDELVYIDFEQPFIEIEQQQDLLSPFLVAQFLRILKRIVRKGLKKSYYTVTNNLQAKVKGKILVSDTVRRNTMRGKATHTVCRYQEFGINCDENKILKKAYGFARRVVEEYEKGVKTQPLSQLIHYIHPAFEQVSDDIDINRIKSFASNPLFKEYDQALTLALLILKRYSYNITQTGSQKIATPPFWIDMSKLFELYVFKQLRKISPPGHVLYHLKARRQEIDFVLRSDDPDGRFVIDTKYKPQYHDHTVSKDDIRQLCGYSRLEKVYEELGITDYSRNINCLIIYSHQECKETLCLSDRKKQSGYVNFYKLGIKLPVIEE